MGKSTISVAIFNSKLLVYQRVNLHFPMVFLWFSYGFPMVSNHLVGSVAWSKVQRRLGLGQQGQPLKIDTHTYIYNNNNNNNNYYTLILK